MAKEAPVPNLRMSPPCLPVMPDWIFSMAMANRQATRTIAGLVDRKAD